MRHSIRFKITFTLTVMVILTILITWVINRTFLSSYYMLTKMNALDRAYHEVVNIYNNSENEDKLSEEDTLRLEKLESQYSINVYLFNENASFLFPSPENIGAREYAQMISMQAEYLYGLNNPNIRDRRTLKQSASYRILRLLDVQRDANYLDMFGLINTTFHEINSPNANLDNIGIILMRTNLESIGEGVAIANDFLAYVGIIAVILGTIAMLIISKKFTKPILQMAGIAKKMTDLDFEIKYKGKSKDEIGELGTSINLLSDKLETTISELKHANNELMTDIQKKTEIDEMRKEFLSNVSHELKTPISLIQGYAEGLKENINEDAESRDFYCEVIMDEADKMNKMVKKLLNLNELEFGNNQVNFERFDIVTLIRSVLNSTEILFKQKEVSLHFDQEEPVYVWADEYLVEQVVTNYISNALNHVAGQKIIEIKLIPMDNRVRVAVFNTGENIPEEDLDKIWIKFYKVDKARTREYGGSGIGLSIVKAIMNSMNQEFGVINRSVGVEFWFELDTQA